MRAHRTSGNVIEDVNGRARTVSATHRSLELRSDHVIDSSRVHDRDCGVLRRGRAKPGQSPRRARHRRAARAGVSPEDAQRWATSIRKLGIDRILFGSDATGATPTPGDAWAALRKLLPLTDEELLAIGNNLPPYMR
jgi:hypothetical protein